MFQFICGILNYCPECCFKSGTLAIEALLCEGGEGEITWNLLDKDETNISGIKNKQVNHAHEISFLVREGNQVSHQNLYVKR
jgi:hypothetical protein